MKFRVEKHELSTHGILPLIKDMDKSKIDHIEGEIFSKVIVMNIYEKSTKEIENMKETILKAHIESWNMAAYIPNPSATAAKDINAYRISSSILNTFYGPPISDNGLSTLGAANLNFLYAIPLIVPISMTVDRIGIDIGLGNAGTNVRLGIYRSTVIYPGSLLLDTGTVVLGAIPGITSIIINQTLTPGLYWLAFLSDTDVSMSTFGSDSTICILGLGSTDFTVPLYAFRVAQAFGALPNPYPNGATALSSTIDSPLIGVRLVWEEIGHGRRRKTEKWN